MNIWILNHYSVPQRYYYLARSYNFAKELIARGHKVTVFAASSAHNSDINLIEDKRLFCEIEEDGIPYVLFRARQYQGSGKARVINHIEGAWRMYRHCPKFIDKYGRPDVIFASAGQSLTLVAGIFLAKKLGIPCVSEVTDLWPESFVAYDMISADNPLLKLLYTGERWIYKKSDALIFSMEGGRDYILGKGWDKGHGGPVDMSKVYHINNGVDLGVFDHNKVHYVVEDADLDDNGTFKVVYCGSIRKVNDVGQLLDVAAKLKETEPRNIRLIIYGDGDEKVALEEKARAYGLDNIVFKGFIEKKYIPSVLSRSDLCLMHWKPTPIANFGMSMNKLFEYFAGGKPILSNNNPAYDLISKHSCGISADIRSPEEYAGYISDIAQLPPDEYNALCSNARRAAEDYDFAVLTDKLEKVLEGAINESHHIS